MNAMCVICEPEFDEDYNDIVGKLVQVNISSRVLPLLTHEEHSIQEAALRFMRVCIWDVKFGRKFIKNLVDRKGLQILSEMVKRTDKNIISLFPYIMSICLAFKTCTEDKATLEKHESLAEWAENNEVQRKEEIRKSCLVIFFCFSFNFCTFFYHQIHFLF